MADKADSKAARAAHPAVCRASPARALGDDLSQSEWALLAELAGVLDAWPARSAVARRALDVAADRLQQLAAEEAGRVPEASAPGRA